MFCPKKVVVKLSTVKIFYIISCIGIPIMDIFFGSKSEQQNLNAPYYHRIIYL